MKITLHISFFLFVCFVLFCFVFKLCIKKTILCCTYVINELLQRKDFIFACKKNILNSDDAGWRLLSNKILSLFKSSLYLWNKKDELNYSPAVRQKSSLLLCAVILLVHVLEHLVSRGRDDGSKVKFEARPSQRFLMSLWTSLLLSNGWRIKVK